MNYWLNQVVINKFFKQSSINGLLKLWSLITGGAVASIFLLALYSNTLFNDEQQQLENQVWPLENDVRKLSQITTKLLAQQHQALHHNVQHQTEKNMWAAFESHMTNLSLSLEQGEQTDTLNKINESYQQLLILDDAGLTLLEQQESSSEQLDMLAVKVESQFQKVHESILGLMLKTDSEKVANVGSQFDTNDIQDLHKALYLLQNASIHLLLTYESMMHENASNELVESSQKQLIEKGQNLTEAISSLTQSASFFPEFDEEVEQLITDLKFLQGLIYLNDEAVYGAKFNLLEIQTNLSETQNNSIKAALVLIANVDKLAELVNAQSNSRITSLSENLVSNYWLILIIGLVALLAVILFIVPISRRINIPLQELRKGMHALSEKRFHTRLKEREGCSEFALLATDFNLFAETTQDLIKELAGAKVSLESNHQRLLAILNGVPEAILTLSNEGVITASNPAAEKVLGANENQLQGKKIMQFFVGLPPDFSQFNEVFRQECDFEGINLKQESFSLQASLSPIVSQNDDAWVCVIADVSNLKQAEKRLIEKTSELDAIFENAMVGIAYIKDRTFLRINHKFEELFSCHRTQIEGESTRLIYHNEEAFHSFGEIAYSMLEQEGSFQADIQLKKGSGQEFWGSVTAKNISQNEPRAGSIWLFEDISLQRENEQRLRRLASFDSLTGLPNRTVFNDRLEHAIAKSDRNSTSLAVFFMDLDNFKNINDSLGHKTGDLLLCEVAARLKKSVRAEDTVARLGGDEFTVIIEDIGSARYVGKVAEKVLLAISQPYQLEQLEVNVSPSIGISLYPSDGQTLDFLVKNADAAMYHAKKIGKNNFQFYSADLNAQANQRLEMEAALRKAAENDEFYLHFQPQIDLESDRIVGAEALLRWNSETFGNVSPAVFVPILEETGLISAVGEFVLRKSCEAYLQIRHEVTEEFVVAVNLSGRQFKGGQLATLVKDLLDELDMPSKNLELEITESMLMEDTQLAIKTLRDLSDLGIMLAVDDFGTGYSSLAYLKQFPLDVLKIDRSFVSDVTVDDDDAAIVDAILAISRRLKLDVVAEGIETVEQLSFLQSHGCQRGQGFHFSRPLDLDRLIDFLHQTSVELS